MKARPRKRKPRKATAKPARRRKARPFDDEVEPWMAAGSSAEREAKK